MNTIKSKVCWPGTDIVKSSDNAFTWHGEASVIKDVDVAHHLGIKEEHSVANSHYVHKAPVLNFEASISNGRATKSLTCIHCGNKFMRATMRINQGQDKFCSHSCANKHNYGGYRKEHLKDTTP